MAYSRIILISCIIACTGLGLPLGASEANPRELRVLSADRTLPEGLALRFSGDLEQRTLNFQNGKRSNPITIPADASAVEVVRSAGQGEFKPGEVEVMQSVSLQGLGNRILLLFVSTGTGWKITALQDDTQTQPVGTLVIFNGTQETLLAEVGKTKFEVPAGRMGKPTDIRKFAETKRMVSSEVMDEETGEFNIQTYEVVENGVMVTLRRPTGPHDGHLFEGPITAGTNIRSLLIVLPPLQATSKRYRILLVPEHFPTSEKTPVTFIENNACKRVFVS